MESDNVFGPHVSGELLNWLAGGLLQKLQQLPAAITKSGCLTHQTK